MLPPMHRRCFLFDRLILTKYHAESFSVRHVVESIYLWFHLLISGVHVKSHGIILIAGSRPSFVMVYLILLFIILCCLFVIICGFITSILDRFLRSWMGIWVQRSAKCWSCRKKSASLSTQLELLCADFYGMGACVTSCGKLHPPSIMPNLKNFEIYALIQMRM